MNHRTSRGAVLAALVTIAALTVPQPARACSSSELRRGLTIKTASEARQIAGDGVLAFDAFVRGETPEVALAGFSLHLSPETGGPAIAGAVSHRTLGRAAYGPIEDYSQIVVVWRPWTPLAPGAYTAHMTVPELPEGVSFPVVVGDMPAGPLSPPRVAAVAVHEYDGESREVVCCEQSGTSCGPRSLCMPTLVEVVPGFRVEATLAPADVERAHLWVAPWDGEAAGVPFERIPQWQTFPEARPWWSEWSSRSDIRLPEAAGERCIVVGATSLIDGSVVLAPPFCGELGASYEDPRSPDFSEQVESDACLGPPVYEHDGSPYPREPESGCRVASSGAPLLLVVVLLARRRRRDRQG